MSIYFAHIFVFVYAFSLEEIKQHQTTKIQLCFIFLSILSEYKRFYIFFTLNDA